MAKHLESAAVLTEDRLPLQTKIGRALIRSGPYFKGRRRLEKLLSRLVAPGGHRDVLFRSLDGFLIQGGSPREGHITDGVFWRGNYEPGTALFLSRWLQPEDVLFDIGAHFGYFTLLAGVKHPQIKVVAFEPHPRVRAELLRNIELNDLHNVTVRSEALSSENGEAVLSQPAKHAAAASTLAALDDLSVHERLVVATRRLDDVLAEIGLFPAVMKIDVEGWEGHVLQGAQAVLQSAEAPLLILEVNEEGARHTGSSCAAWVERLAALGYQFLRIDDAHNRRDVILQHWTCPKIPGGLLHSTFNIIAYQPARHRARIETEATIR